MQALGGFAVGFGLGLLPGGGVVDMTATAAGVLDEGTPEARLGKSLGEIAGGFVLTGLGVGGEAASWALHATGLGAVVGVPAAIVSAEAVVGGLGNIAVGAANLTQAMSTGSGGTTAAKRGLPGVSGHPRAGSALKADPHHAFPDVVDNFAQDATRFEIPTRGPGGQVARMSEPFQVEGSLRGRGGVFEWIVDQGQMTHRRFIPGGKVTGYPNQVPGR